MRTTGSTHGRSLPDMLLHRASTDPLAVAVVDGGAQLTFADLVHQAGMLATHLLRVRTGTEDCVGLYVEPSLTLMTGAWGILFSGHAYVPLSPDYPDERVRLMIEDSGVGMIVTQEHLRDRLRGLAPSSTRIVTTRDCDADGPPGDVLRPRITPDALAYVIYTSGSTGRPKGVMIEHGSIVGQLGWLTEHHGIDASTVVLQKTPMSFDAAQWEILAPACGSRVVMGESGCHRDPERLVALIRRHEVNTLQCVPTLLSVLLGLEEVTACTSLRAVFSGGEALPRQLAAECVATLPACRLVNLYGPTECTINASSYEVDPHRVADGPDPVPIGFPAAATEYRVLDASGRPVAEGVVGELYISGAQVGRGYLGRPDLTAERFVDGGRTFRTGDLVHHNADGSLQFVGRADNQVKVRGHRIELDEVRTAIEGHDWIRHAGVVVREDPRTGVSDLVACIELNPREAALMDQGNHGAHHRSKASRLQVRAQLSAPGLRADTDLRNRPTIGLPGRDAPARDRAAAFGRKTYRFYEGEPLDRAVLLDVLGRRPEVAGPRSPLSLTLEELGALLRHVAAHHSDERLLPKYAYPSPGSLYATQIHLEVGPGGPVPPGTYYHHPERHELVLVGRRPAWAEQAGMRLHLLGRTAAIATVYRNNIHEVLEIEAGHIVGLFDDVLAGVGIAVRPHGRDPGDGEALRTSPDDHFLGSFDLVPHPGTDDETTDVYLQARPGTVRDLPAGQYRYRDGRLVRFADDLVLRKHVIAINQAVYERAAVGIAVVGRAVEPWLRYVGLGRTVQRLSMNGHRVGFMSSGYSSESGNDLPAARRITDLLTRGGEAPGPSYFVVGGRVSAEQWHSEGMKEDAVHMRGPAELVRDDLAAHLPDYMVPSKVVVLDALPLSPNGKVDLRAVAALEQLMAVAPDRPLVAPRTPTETTIAGFWSTLMRVDEVSVDDDFFATGGNSLVAVALINRINRELGCALPVQALFQSPTVEQLATRVDARGPATGGRLVPLAGDGPGRPVYCWPGLGGYPMNLRHLGAAAATGRSFLGVQAHGINAGEVPYATVEEMAAADVAALRTRQPHGPYTLWGYSFGARVAFETARLLEEAGEEVDDLVLIAPGSPLVEERFGQDDVAGYGSATFIAIMFSVFAGSVTDRRIPACLDAVVDDVSFVDFVVEHFPDLPRELVERVVDVVTCTYGFRFRPMPRRRVRARVTVFRATGDDRSFIENGDGWATPPARLVDLDADHYGLLRDPAVRLLASAIHDATTQKEPFMPHITIKHFPAVLAEPSRTELRDAVTTAVTRAFGCPAEVVSIALQPIEPHRWDDEVRRPEILGHPHLLITPVHEGSEAVQDAA